MLIPRPPGRSARIGLAVVGALMAATLSLQPVSAQAAVDPFYTDLLEQGSQALESGRPAKAEGLLHTACFGLLDDTTLLAEGLVQLARAQALSGHRIGLRRTLDRLLAVESRFDSYSKLARNDLKVAFERDLSAALTSAEIMATGLLSQPAEAAVEAPPAPPPPSRRQQRRALEQRLSESPSDRDALWQLAELDVSARRLKRASSWLDRLLADHPDDGPARCLRGEIAVLRGECEPVLAALPCAGVATRTAAATFAAACLEAAGRPEEAAELLASLPEDPPPGDDEPVDLEPTPEAGSGPSGEASAGEIDSASEPSAPDFRAPAAEEPRDNETTSGPGPPSTSESVGTEPPGGDAGETNPAPEIDPAPDEVTPVDLVTRDNGAPLAVRLLRLRDAVDRAQVRSDLIEVRRGAEALANEHPESTTAQFLAAEIAFRSADYASAVDYFTRGGGPSPEQHVLLFFMAVSLFETGDLEAAERALSEALPRLEAGGLSDYVRSYVDKILGSGPQ